MKPGPRLSSMPAALNSAGKGADAQPALQNRHSHNKEATMKRLLWTALAMLLALSVVAGSAVAGELTLNVLGQPLATGLIRRTKSSRSSRTSARMPDSKPR